eukprot:228059-Pleurochrysis_carterae.AAC.3
MSRALHVRILQVSDASARTPRSGLTYWAGTMLSMPMEVYRCVERACRSAPSRAANSTAYLLILANAFLFVGLHTGILARLHADLFSSFGAVL